MGMNTIMLRLKAIPLAASSSVPMRPTIIMKMAKAADLQRVLQARGQPEAHEAREERRLEAPARRVR